MSASDERAFPGSGDSFQKGISLRDYFAARAMQGILSKTGANESQDGLAVPRAYKIADAMMAARAAGTETEKEQKAPTALDPIPPGDPRRRW